MQSKFRFLVAIVLAVSLSNAFGSITGTNQMPSTNMVCNLTHVSEAIKKLETKLGNLIAMVNKASTPQPTPTANLASSCNELFRKYKSTKSQVYTLMFKWQTIPVYCHMGNFGCGDGGWTLAMKIDGTKKTFHYSSHFWSDRNVYNLAGGKTGFDKQETKLPTYWETHFSKICLGMRIGHTTRFVVINRSANSLYALIADGKYRALSLGRNTWKFLFGYQASLQNHCNKEGFNVQSEDSSAQFPNTRIGILSNNENNCGSCDSRIGFGSGGLHDDSNTCGNEASHRSDNGDKHIKAMGYIVVQ